MADGSRLWTIEAVPFFLISPLPFGAGDAKLPLGAG
jgi:hypothetical protein